MRRKACSITGGYTGVRRKQNPPLQTTRKSVKWGRVQLEHQGECVGVIGLVRSTEEQLFVEADRIKLSFLAKQIESGFNIQGVLKLNQQKQSDLLTERERELVNYLEKGLKNRDIAKKLYVSEHTIKKHLQNLYRKFNAGNRTELLYKMK
ncbi:hypothetical protein CEW92_12890 [Bacillaceae bacterium SAS-127]|nr:hypothetical protein CEW92_12890 [Bacillaceae bacterium SAS-127]